MLSMGSRAANSKGIVLREGVCGTSRAKAEDGHRSPGTYEEALKQDCVLPCPTANGKNLRVFIRDASTYKKGNYI